MKAKVKKPRPLNHPPTTCISDEFEHYILVGDWTMKARGARKLAAYLLKAADFLDSKEGKK